MHTPNPRHHSLSAFWQNRPKRRKVGDTLEAIVLGGQGPYTYSWAVDGETVVGADDETFEVEGEMLGSVISVTVTDADGNEATDATEPVGVFTFEIESAKATKVNEITVTFADAVEAENVTFTVTSGNTDFPVADVDWLTDDVAVVKTSANMAKGTYTVTATDSVTSDTDSYEFEVEKQGVAKIVFLNEVALTNEDKDEAYAYYDVLDQYEESMRSSASIQWSGSCDIKADKTTGKLTLKKKTANDDWVYNEQIYITGVYTKTGVAGSATLKVGTEQALDHIEMVGFLKKGTSEIVDRLPADFKTSEYYLLFHAMDRNDCPIEAEDVTDQDVTFVSSDPLVVKELTDFAVGGLTVKGTEYSAVFVEPGINVAEGGEVTVSAIANKTGTKTDLNFMVGEDPVVVTFNISAPSGVVADGDTGVTIPFEAIDDKGHALTNFRALAKQEIFNTLSFTTSEGALTLAEQDDGTAKLTWSDDEKYYADAILVNGVMTANNPWSYAVTTDDVDRPVSLTVVVVGGDPDNEMLYVSDKRRPNAIADVDLATVYVEGDAFTLSTGSFSYYDQYGKLIDYDDDGKPEGEDNGFFAAAAANELKNIDFKDYSFGVRIENAGTGYVEYANDTGNTYLSGAWSDDAAPVWTVDADPKQAVVTFDSTITYATTTNILSAAPGEGFKFDIAKFKAANGITINSPADWESVSPTKFHGLTVVDITKVKNFTISDLNTFYIGDDIQITGKNFTGKGIIGADFLTDLKATTPKTIAAAHNLPASHEQKIVVKGTYNGTSVTIPVAYYNITANKFTDDTTDEDAIEAGKRTFDATAVDAIKYTDLYDQTTANGTAKLGTDTITATINEIYNPVGYWAYDAVKNELYIDTEKTQEQALATITTAQNIVAGKATAQLTAANSSLATSRAADTDGDLDTTNTPDVTTGGLAAFLTDNGYYATTVADAAAAVTTAEGNLTTAETNLENTTYTDEAKQAAALGVYDGITGAANLDENGVPTNDAINAAVVAVDEAVIDGADKTDAQTYLKLYAAVERAEYALEAAQLTQKISTAYKTAQDAAIAVGDEIDEIDEVLTIGAANIQKTVDGDTDSIEKIVYDATKKAITFSDQSPYAASISGVAESYTLNPLGTEIYSDIQIAAKAADDSWKVLDQYGVTFAGAEISYTISNTKESEDGYAENNFKVTNNGQATASIEGAERGDTFDLVVSVDDTNLSVTSKITVGADGLAMIVNDRNFYTEDGGLKDILETQRLAGLQ